MTELPPATVVDATRVLRYRQLDPIRLERIVEDPAVLRRLDADASKAHAIVLAARIGCEKWLTLLEHDHFDPLDPAREPLLEARAVLWMGLSFVVATIPVGERALFAAAAARCGLRVADGVPLALASEGCYWFPLRSGRANQLENLGPPPVMPGDPGYEAAREREAAECEAIRARSVERWRRIVPRN